MLAHRRNDDQAETAPRCLERQREAVGETGHGAIEAAEQDDFEDLVAIEMRRERGEFGIAERRAMVQRVDRRDQRRFGLRPARRIGVAVDRGANLVPGQARRLGEDGDMHAPLVFAPVQRAGAVDHDLALPQAQRTVVEQAAGAEFLPGPRMPGHDAEQHQRRRTAHDAVELGLNLRGIGWRERRDA